MRNSVAKGATTPHRYACLLPSRQGVSSMWTFWVRTCRATSTQGTSRASAVCRLNLLTIPGEMASPHRSKANATTGLQPWAELTFDLGWQASACPGVTTGAGQAMELILDDVGSNDGQLSHLMTQ